MEDKNSLQEDLCMYTMFNAFKLRTPLSYERYYEVTIIRQVVIRGNNKYLINGSNLQSRISSGLSSSM